MKTEPATETESRPDYEIAREELEALYAKHCPQVVGNFYGEASEDNGTGKPWRHRAWVFLIKGHELRYKTGMGIREKPTAAEVLACYCRDGLDSEVKFADWCAKYGESEDSRRAEATYFKCQKSLAIARAVLSSRALVQQFAELSSRL